mmetsp:Transcript_27833/g.26891  ORF Transcript_27833/g.26891 Transcript_27833/m.26891 type:complete len:89 (+) Transcript_27833:310-576(+)|eukprot:CAMPEP_0170560534 /NCGR_PEP_ID=MMETSP0211-20121228/49404_1 /TAXON_ID=311385 /ORGANISM="Pseudokeronopsis sp., Strain OXSARD2" /LENGTH=88 /DNA_ID=CAMNT_0010874815 /DNA_START=292 /DNA_END=558 /DNA_ORIENTATION=-
MHCFILIPTGFFCGILPMFLSLYIPYGLVVFYKYNFILYGTGLTIRSYELFLYLVAANIYGASMATSGSYLYLNYQGFTRKEKTVIEK